MDFFHSDFIFENNRPQFSNFHESVREFPSDSAVGIAVGIDFTIATFGSGGKQRK